MKVLKQKSLRHKLYLDPVLLIGLILLSIMGLFLLYSASINQTYLLKQQILHLILGYAIMIAVAQINPQQIKSYTPWLFLLSIILLTLVLILGQTSKGATRWLNLGLIRFQPSEVAKLAIPLFLAWYVDKRDSTPPPYRDLAILLSAVLIPAALTAKQPDLGTAIMLIFTGCWVIFLAGVSWRLIIISSLAIIGSIPFLWHFLHQYQRQRIITFLNPESDPLGAGYHIIQSKIAIGSGGLFGKGWLQGTQTNLDFVPEHTTDFIFSVFGEEFGFVGSLIMLGLFLLVIGRCMQMALRINDNFGRLLVASLTLSFAFSLFINVGMVVGILPVVGIPLPLFSYGGTSIMTLMASFGIIMSVYCHRNHLR